MNCKLCDAKECPECAKRYYPAEDPQLRHPAIEWPNHVHGICCSCQRNREMAEWYIENAIDSEVQPCFYRSYANCLYCSRRMIGFPLDKPQICKWCVLKVHTARLLINQKLT